MSKGGIALRENDASFLEGVEQEFGLDRRKIEADLLEERYKSAEAMAQALGVDVAIAKKILADPYIQQNALKVFVQSAKAELDLIEIPTLLAIIKAPADYASPDQKRRAATRLRKIVEGSEKRGPLVQVNTQVNNNFPDGSITQFVKKLDDK